MLASGFKPARVYDNIVALHVALNTSPKRAALAFGKTKNDAENEIVAEAVTLRAENAAAGVATTPRRRTSRVPSAGWCGIPQACLDAEKST